MNLTGKNALVTGGSRGIGRAVCLELARQGANVAVNYAGNAQAAEEVAAACRALGVESFAVQADVADAAAVDAMVKQVIETFGSLHILVNNAGITKDKLASPAWWACGAIPARPTMPPARPDSSA